jgi:hypothetical protein
MPTAIVEPDGCGRHGDGVRFERALALNSEMSNCAKEEVSSISSWDQFKSVQILPRQNSSEKRKHCALI